MAQTITVNMPPGIGQHENLKIGALRIVSDALETLATVNWATYGIKRVLLFGLTPLEAYTDAAKWNQLSAGSQSQVEYRWGTPTLQDVLVWAIGY